MKLHKKKINVGNNRALSKELITFGMPAYKRICIGEVIESILNQSYKNIELVIVNDASPENLNEIICKFNDSRIHYYENKTNLGINGPVKNWNKVLDYASGEYFVLASDDDVYQPTFAEELVEILMYSKSSNLIHCRLKTIDSNKQIIISPSCPSWESGIDFMWHCFNSKRLLSISEFMCRTKALQSIGGFVDFPLAWSSDYATWMSLAKISGVYYVNTILMEKRNYGHSLSSKFSLRLALASCYHYEQWLDEYLNQVVAEGTTNTLLLEDVLAKYPKYLSEMKLSSIVGYWRGRTNILSPFILFFQWMKYRKKYNVSLFIFFHSLIYLCWFLFRPMSRYLKR